MKTMNDFKTNDIVTSSYTNRTGTVLKVLGSAVLVQFSSGPDGLNWLSKENLELVSRPVVEGDFFWVQLSLDDLLLPEEQENAA
jgi:hypothetical protein